MMKRYFLMITLGFTSAAMGQTATLSSRASVSTSGVLQREFLSAQVVESQPTSGTGPGAMATPHQQNVTQAPGRGAAASPQFITMAAQSGLTEVELGKLALNKTSNPDVKKFAAVMVDDHTKANQELQSIASSKNVSVPTALDADHAAMVRSMGNRSGKEFDAVYAKHMVADHDKAIDLFETETGDTDQDLAAYAKKTLPVLQNHQQMAKRLAAM